MIRVNLLLNMSALTFKFLFKTLIALNLFFLRKKDKLNRPQMSEVVHKASCWDCQECYIRKAKGRLQVYKAEHFKSVTKGYS